MGCAVGGGGGLLMWSAECVHVCIGEGSAGGGVDGGGWDGGEGCG